MKILIAGLGSIGKKHIKAIRSIDNQADIFAVRSGRNAESFPGITNIFDLDKIKNDIFDFAIIANPTSEHKRTITELLQFGMPLFIEKPLYYSLNIKETVKLTENKEIITYVACNLRFMECIRFVKEQIGLKNKRLNELNVYCGSYLPEWRPDTDFRKNYSAIAGLGGGVHIDLIHELDYLYWLFGMPQKVSRNFRSQSSLSISSYDYANYVLDYDGFCANVVLNYYRRDAKRSLELVFEDETWNVDLLKNQVSSKDRILFVSDQKISDTYEKQMEYFMNCISSKADSFNTISDAYNVLQICLEQNDTK